MSSARIKGGGREGESGRVEREGRMGSRGGKVCEEDARRVLQKYVARTHIMHTRTCIRQQRARMLVVVVCVFMYVYVCVCVHRSLAASFRMQGREASSRDASEKRTAEGAEGGKRTGVRTRTRARPPEVSASRAQATRLAPKGGGVLNP